MKKEVQGKRLTKAEGAELEKLVDYLNFFEFALYLHKIGTLKREDVRQMFEYYLNLLKSDVIKEYAQKEGFELLHDYMVKSS